ncbi:MAG: hypothetical protein HC890_17075 [Chloroflexaceae bacterium]|nr:hypothetical protein [Chloroflexaceae bacterium]
MGRLVRKLAIACASGSVALSASMGLFVGSPVLAQKKNNCTLLQPVGGQGTLVRKTVTAPSIPIGIARLFNNNWNTDFAIPSRASFNRFKATLTPLSSGNLTVRMFLKYSDGSADESFNEVVPAQENQPIVLEGIPRANSDPFQVNIFVGDLNSIGRSYTVTVAGCP